VSAAQRRMAAAAATEALDPRAFGAD